MFRLTVSLLRAHRGLLTRCGVAAIGGLARRLVARCTDVGAATRLGRLDSLILPRNQEGDSGCDRHYVDFALRPWTPVRYEQPSGRDRRRHRDRRDCGDRLPGYLSWP